MTATLLPLQPQWIQATKDLIAEVVLEFYGDLDFLPKSKVALLQHYEQVGYLRDLDQFQIEYANEHGAFLVVKDNEQIVGCGGLHRINPLCRRHPTFQNEWICRLPRL